MTRAAAISRAESVFRFRRVQGRSCAPRRDPDREPESRAHGELARYLESEIRPALEKLGFTCRTLTQARAKGPFLYAERIERPDLPTVFGYGHGDVIRGLDAGWNAGLSPWTLTEKDGRYYGRGVVDNKGQHTINIAAQAAVLAERGKLGFNAKWLIEMGEETGSPGLRELCAEHQDLLAGRRAGRLGRPAPHRRPADHLSRHARRLPDRPLDRCARGRAPLGQLGRPALEPGDPARARALDHHGPTGQIRIPEWVPADSIPDSVKRALADCEIKSGPGDPEIDPNWAEPGLTLAEKVFAWCTFEILAMTAGNPESPVNAVPPRAWARGQIRFVVGTNPDEFLPALRRHLDRHGFPMVQIARGRDDVMKATRLDPEHPWARWAATSIAKTTNTKPAVLPNVGGSLPNDIFSEGLGLPTIWVPHSYPGCSQHAPNEHFPTALAREALGIMAGLYWDLGEPGTPARTK